ncbi:MAG: penicillin-binding transpeptidase domain-containing protein [Acidimicrobiales bacterium]
MYWKRRLLVGGGIVALGVLLAAVLWYGLLRPEEPVARPGMRDGDPASDAADAFATSWQLDQLAKVPVTVDSGDVAAKTKAVVGGLSPEPTVPDAVAVTSIADAPTATAQDRKVATVSVTWRFDSGRTWQYETKVPLIKGTDDRWLVSWTPSVVHPRLEEGDKLTLVRFPARRGELLGTDGKALVGLRPVVHVAIRPSASSDPAGLARQVAGIVGVDADALVARAIASNAGVVTVITFREEAIADRRANLEAIPGVELTDDEIPLAPTRDFARALIGQLGPATQEVADASKGRVQPGDYVGLSGLQAAQDEVLGGTPRLSIRVDPGSAARAPYELRDFPAKEGRSLTITLDPEVQAAADEVMATAPKPAALVAIRVSTGDVLAVANGPAGAESYNRAMIGRYPPGSTFKVASSLALLQKGLTPDTPVDCPATIVVGREFQNAEGEVLGTVPFRKDFADSCNTAFVGQSRKITPLELAAAAESLGYRKLSIGVPLAGGSVPTDASETEHAADMIGQGKVEASPFVVALASASVAAGRTLEPRLIVDPKDPTPAEGAALPAKPVQDLRDLMRGVVTNGTGTAVLGIPGGDVYGKTGTAEFGTEDPPQTHAWFTGYQGDVAFAVLVEDGGFGGRTAAPLAASFLSKLAAQ